MSGITIATNVSALRAERRLTDSTLSLDAVYERLASGQRINRASDDAAGLAIASTLNARARIFTQGVRNVNDGLSYISIAGGALRELKSILYRQRELATQSSNGTYSHEQRKALEVELKELCAEWNRVLDSTTFNGRSVLSAKERELILQAGVGTSAVLNAGFGSEAAAAQDDPTRISIANDGTEEDAASGERPTISYDGRYVAFTSLASNLVEDDNNASWDVFMRDLLTGTTTRVSTNSSGGQASGWSSRPSISADGRYVAFLSDADDLVEGDENGTYDIFVKDLWSGETTVASADASGLALGAIVTAPAISADGRYVVFSSDASGIVAGDSNEVADVFRKDLLTGEVRRVSTDSTGAESNDSSGTCAISADGRYVAFNSSASNLVAGDGNGASDVFVKDVQTGQTRIVSTTSSGAQGTSSGDMSISADGRYVAFTASGLGTPAWNVFVKDLQTNETKVASADVNGVAQSGFEGRISADGRYVAFHSSSALLVPGDTNGAFDVFVKDLETGQIGRASTRPNGVQAVGGSWRTTISGDGRFVAFAALATSDLLEGDQNGLDDNATAGNPLAEWSVVSRSQWLSVATQQDALIAQGRIDQYLSELNGIEGSLGALEARLGTAVSNLHSMTENMQAAESRITDADMGQEAASLIRNQIVQKAASAVLAQATRQPEIALQLLRT